MCAHIADVSTGRSVTVTILSVHCDDAPPYYTVRLPDGREKGTQRERLRLLSAPRVASPPPTARACARP